MKIQAKCRIPEGLHVYRNKNDVWGSTTPAGVEEAEIWKGNSWDTVPRIVKYITANSAANGGSGWVEYSYCLLYLGGIILDNFSNQ